MKANGVNRRGFLRSALGAGAALAFRPSISDAAEQTDHVEPLNVALIGAGVQGMTLLSACRNVPGLRFTAVCDIWEAYCLRRATRILQHYGHPATPYTDCQTMLDKEKNLQAAIIATPDFWHARHATACLNAGLHVYCETPMSNTIAGARRMVETARHSGRLLQIGHQRRSNPRYILCRDKLLEELKLLGRIIAVNGQWNRPAHSPLGWPKRCSIDPAALRRYGYESMAQFRNWRWYKGLGNGPAVDRGAHQIDVYNWFLNARPTSVIASARTNYYDKKTHQCHDTVAATYEYEPPQGPITATYQTLTANGHEGYVEKFLGDQGTLVLSERSHATKLYPEPPIVRRDMLKWAMGLKQGYLRASKPVMEMVERMSTQDLAQVLSVADTPDPVTINGARITPATLLSCDLSVSMTKPPHQPHLENFFDAIRGHVKLTCPAEVGYETAVTVLKVNEAAQAGRRLDLKPQDFAV